MAVDADEAGILGGSNRLLAVACGLNRLRRCVWCFQSGSSVVVSRTRSTGNVDSFPSQFLSLRPVLVFWTPGRNGRRSGRGRFAGQHLSFPMALCRPRRVSVRWSPPGTSQPHGAELLISVAAPATMAVYPMNENELFQAALGILPPWLINQCRFSVEAGRLDLHLRS